MATPSSSSIVATEPFSGSKNSDSDLVPAAELVDLEEVGRSRELRLVRELLQDWAVAVVLVDLLRLLGEEEVAEGLSLRIRILRDGDRVLDQDRLVGDDVVDVLAGLLRGDRLVLIGEQDVALAAHERLQRVARRRVLDRRVLEDLLEEVERLLLGLALLQLRAVGGHQVPLRAARRERVRRDDLDVTRDEVVPGLDVLRVALADGEHHDRVGDEPVVLVLVPVRRDESLVDKPRDVRLERERRDVRVEAGDDCVSLVARGAVGLLERDALAVRRLVEGGDDLLVRLLRGGVGDQRQAAAAAVTTVRVAVGAAARGDPDGEREGRDRESQFLDERARHQMHLSR